MPFPVSYKATLYTQQDNKELFVKSFFNRVIEKIDATGVDYKAAGYKLLFKGSIFRFAWNGWHVLNGISKGKIEIREYNENIIQIKHKIYFTEYFIISLFFSLLLIPAWHTEWIIIVVIAIWIIFYAGNFLISAVRFNKLLSNILYDKNITKQTLS